MSQIPPTFLGGIVQAHGAQAHAAERKARETAARPEEAAFANQLQDVIEQTDRDGQVYSDAEGPGSQGRPFEGEPPAPPCNSEDAPPGAGLDVQA